MSSRRTTQAENMSVDVTFALLSTPSLRPDARLSTPVAQRFHEAQIMRDPLDLRQHVRRVWLAVEKSDSQRLFGALVDVFLVLGSKGHKLRAALLGLASPHLEQEDLAYLHTHLDHGLKGHDSIPACSGSVLERGLIGQREMVSRERAKGLDNSDPLKEAIALLNDGQVESARQLLEDALLSDPGNLAIEMELLEIYRRSHDTSGLCAMRDRMLTNGIEPSPAWGRH